VTVCNESLLKFRHCGVTKYDQLLRNVAIDLEDRHYGDRSINVSKKAKAREAKKIFEKHFLGP